MTLTVTLCLVAFVLGMACESWLVVRRERTDRAYIALHATETRREWATRHRTQQRAHDRLRQYQRRTGGTPAA